MSSQSSHILPNSTLLSDDGNCLTVIHPPTSKPNSRVSHSREHSTHSPNYKPTVKHGGSSSKVRADSSQTVLNLANEFQRQSNIVSHGGALGLGEDFGVHGGFLSSAHRRASVSQVSITQFLYIYRVNIYYFYCFLSLGLVKHRLGTDNIFCNFC